MKSRAVRRAEARRRESDVPVGVFAAVSDAMDEMVRVVSLGPADPCAECEEPAGVGAKVVLSGDRASFRMGHLCAGCAEAMVQGYELDGRAPGLVQ